MCLCYSCGEAGETTFDVKMLRKGGNVYFLGLKYSRIKTCINVQVVIFNNAMVMFDFWDLEVVRVYANQKC